MRKKFGKLFLALAMVLQLFPSSFTGITAKDTNVIDSSYISLTMDNEPTGVFEQGSSELPEAGVGRIKVNVNVDGTVKESKVLTFTSGQDPGKAIVGALEGFLINSVTLNGAAYNQEPIAFDEETAVNMEQTLEINVSTKAILTIHYQDAEGNKIADDETVAAVINQVINVNDKAIENYKAVEDNVVSVVMDTIAKEVTLKYTKVEEVKEVVDTSNANSQKSRLETKAAVTPGTCSTKSSKNCFRQDDTYIDSEGKEYPVYVNASQQGQEHLNHEISFVPGLNRESCQNKTHIAHYGERYTHYVRIAFSGNHNYIAYVRCDKYDNEKEDQVYYAVTYEDEEGNYLAAESVKEGMKPSKVPTLTDGYWTYKGDSKRVIPQNSVIRDKTTFTFHKEKENEVTIYYKAGKNGQVNRTSEKVKESSGKLTGAVATANTNYKFVNWTNSKGEIVSKDSTYIPEKTGGKYVSDIYTANFSIDCHIICYGNIQK